LCAWSLLRCGPAGVTGLLTAGTQRHALLAQDEHGGDDDPGRDASQAAMW
jgi:hypothetical protein